VSLAARLSRQLSDGLVYLLIPVLSVVTPGALSRKVLRRVSTWRWVLADSADQALAGARKHGVVENDAHWLVQWKRAEMLDFRDLYMMLFWRGPTVVGEIDCSRSIAEVQDLPMVGMHWGPGISVLKYLDVNGLEPSFPFRPPEKPLRRSRPFYYLASRMAHRYLVKTLGERAVPVGGAGKKVAGILAGSGSICVLMDAPPMTGRGTMQKTVLDKPARFNTGFPDLLLASGKSYFLWAMNLAGDDSLRKSLELSGPFDAADSEAFLDEFARFLDTHLRGESWHWRLWHAEGQLWL
jgi:hypothetical protein